MNYSALSCRLGASNNIFGPVEMKSPVIYYDYLILWLVKLKPRGRLKRPAQGFKLFFKSCTIF